MSFKKEGGGAYMFQSSSEKEWYINVKNKRSQVTILYLEMISLGLQSFKYIPGSKSH